MTSNLEANSFQSISLFLEAFERIFHKALSLAASHSTEGGSTKSPLGNGSRMKTVYDGSAPDIADVGCKKGPTMMFFIGV